MKANGSSWLGNSSHCSVKLCSAQRFSSPDLQMHMLKLDGHSSSNVLLSPMASLGTPSEIDIILSLMLALRFSHYIGRNFYSIIKVFSLASFSIDPESITYLNYKRKRDFKYDIAMYIFLTEELLFFCISFEKKLQVASTLLYQTFQ